MDSTKNFKDNYLYNAKKVLEIIGKNNINDNETKEEIENKEERQ